MTLLQTISPPEGHEQCLPTGLLLLRDLGANDERMVIFPDADNLSRGMVAKEIAAEEFSRLKGEGYRVRTAEDGHGLMHYYADTCIAFWFDADKRWHTLSDEAIDGQLLRADVLRGSSQQQPTTP